MKETVNFQKGYTFGSLFMIFFLTRQESRENERTEVAKPAPTPAAVKPAAHILAVQPADNLEAFQPAYIAAVKPVVADITAAKPAANLHDLRREMIDAGYTRQELRAKNY